MDHINDSKNIITGKVKAGGNVNIGDTNIYHHYGDRKIKKFLGSTPFLPEVFLGRDQDLINIHQKLFEDNIFLLLISGEGGMGKSSLVAYYYFKYHEHYTHLAWVFAEQSLLDALLTLAIPLEIAFDEQMPNPKRLEVLLDYLRQLQKPCLLVIDNANHLPDLQQHYLALRSCPNFHLLLTTRITEFENAERYAIQALQDHYPIELFQTHYKKTLPQSELELLQQILEAVGYNTLVIELLAKNLRNFNRLKTQYSLYDLLQDLQTKGLLAVQSKTITTGYQAKDTLRAEKPEAIIAAMYDLSELSETENQLLSIFAVLPAENIPFETLETLLPDTENLDDTLLALAQKGWLDYNEANASFKCSPVIQEITQNKNRKNLLRDVEKLASSLIDKLRYQPGTGQFVNIENTNAEIYLNFTENFIKVVKKINRINNAVGILCEYLGNYHHKIGNLDKALEFFNIYRVFEENLSNGFPKSEIYKNNLALSYIKIGEVYTDFGNLEQALAYFKHANSLGKNLNNYYPESIKSKEILAISYSVLGEAYHQLGKLDAAQDSFNKAIILSIELCEIDSTNLEFKYGLAVSHEKLGEIFFSLGNLNDAVFFHNKAAHISEELCRNYPNNIGFKHGLAISYFKLSEIHTALENIEKAIEIFKQQIILLQELAASYPQMISFKNELAVSYSKFAAILMDYKNDTIQAIYYFQKSKELLDYLVKNFPKYSDFQKNLEVVNRILAAL